MIYFGRRIILAAFQHLTGYATPKKTDGGLGNDIQGNHIQRRTEVDDQP
jgi:hypothetical protein